MEKSTPAAYEPTLRSTSVCPPLSVLCMARHTLSRLPAARFRCLSPLFLHGVPLFCISLRRLSSQGCRGSRGLPSLSFSLSTSLFQVTRPGSRPCSRSSNGPSVTFNDCNVSWDCIFVQVRASGFPFGARFYIFEGSLRNNGLPVLTWLCRLLSQVCRSTFVVDVSYAVFPRCPSEVVFPLRTRCCVSLMY